MSNLAFKLIGIMIAGLALAFPAFQAGLLDELLTIKVIVWLIISVCSFILILWIGRKIFIRLYSPDARIEKIDTITSYSAVEKFKDCVLQPERADAKRRLDNCEYWGDTGKWVNLAIGEVESAIDRVERTDDTKLLSWLDAVIHEVERVHEQFRREEDDPDGYGSATISECLNRIREFRECV